jgi:hypothetical protein
MRANATVRRGRIGGIGLRFGLSLSQYDRKNDENRVNQCVLGKYARCFIRNSNQLFEVFLLSQATVVDTVMTARLPILEKPTGFAHGFPISSQFLYDFARQLSLL